MRFSITVALALAATVSAAPKSPGVGTLEARQECVVDCTCLSADRTRSWPDTQRCCVPNGGTLDVPVCRTHLTILPGPTGTSRVLFFPGPILPRYSVRFCRGHVRRLLWTGWSFRMPHYPVP
jgi:hypothetical protein